MSLIKSVQSVGVCGFPRFLYLSLQMTAGTLTVSPNILHGGIKHAFCLNLKSLLHSYWWFCLQFLFKHVVFGVFKKYIFTMFTELFLCERLQNKNNNLDSQSLLWNVLKPTWYYSIFSSWEGLYTIYTTNM